MMQSLQVLDSWRKERAHRLGLKRLGGQKMDHRRWGGQSLGLGSLNRWQLSLRGLRKILELALCSHRHQGVALRGHLHHEVALRGHSYEGVALRGHRYQGVAFRGHRHQEVALRGHRYQGVAHRGHRHKVAL